MADIIEIKTIEGGKTYSLSELMEQDGNVVLVIHGKEQVEGCRWNIRRQYI